jgi:hypothetical protein
MIRDGVAFPQIAMGVAVGDPHPHLVYNWVSEF